MPYDWIQLTHGEYIRGPFNIYPLEVGKGSFKTMHELPVFRHVEKLVWYPYHSVLRYGQGELPSELEQLAEVGK